MKILIALTLALSTVFPLRSSAAHLRPLFHVTAQPACTTGPVRCLARVAHPDSAQPYGFGPKEFHAAYNLPCTPGGSIQAVCPTPSLFGGQTIAIVDAYDDPSVESDLAVYDQAYGLPACTKANGCLAVVNEHAQPSPLPAPDTGWGVEISLDVQTAHEICQTCKIVLVEADSSTVADLALAVDSAASMGATEISNSYGGPDGTGPSPVAPSYDHPGIAITASAGDSGWGPEQPAALGTVIAVGGTSLRLNTNGTYASESAWGNSGSGCSYSTAVNPWQTALSNWAQTGCDGMRGIADVSADADPQTGAAIYDATDGGWILVGGTSLSSPLVAGVIALAGGVKGVANPQSVPYAHTAGFRDVAAGTNGGCSTSMCNAGPGYDGPTGLGTPLGVKGFETGTAPVPTPTKTPTPKPSPTTVPPTPSPTATAVPPTPRPHRHFPVKKWRAWTSKHGFAAVRFHTRSGKVMRAPWIWWRDHYKGRAVKAICGGVMMDPLHVDGGHFWLFQGCEIDVAADGSTDFAKLPWMN